MLWTVYSAPAFILSCTASWWVKKVGGTGGCSISTDSCKFPTEEIWILQILSLPLNSPEIEIISPRCCILDKNSPTKNFSDRWKLRKWGGGGNWLPDFVSQCHWTSTVRWRWRPACQAVVWRISLTVRWSAGRGLSQSNKCNNHH